MAKEFIVEVNLFKHSGKWAYGGLVELSSDVHMWDRLAVFDALADKQKFVTDTCFRSRQFTTVMTVPAEYDDDPMCSLYPILIPAI